MEEMLFLRLGDEEARKRVAQEFKSSHRMKQFTTSGPENHRDTTKNRLTFRATTQAVR
jgi:hypothetical protein